MRRRIAASLGIFGLIGAGWLGVQDHVVGGEPPVSPATVPTAVPTEPPTVQPFFERIEATPSKRTKKQSAVKTKVGTAPATTVLPREEPELLPLEPTAGVPMAVPTTGSSFESLCQRLQPVLKKRFPKCGIELISHRDGIILKGSAANAQEAATIVAAVQTVVDLNSPEGHPQSEKVVNQLEIPGEAQVMLSVKIIEADRSVVKEALQQSRKREPSKSPPEPKTPAPLATTQASASGVYSNSIVEEATANILKDSKSKTICEPTLAVVSGTRATFKSGGEFAIPTIVGVGNSEGTKIAFRGFGTTLEAAPTVIDKEQLRLELICESSQVDKANMTAGVPGFNVRRINTLVQLQAKQSLVMEFPSQSNVEPFQIRAEHSASDAEPTTPRKQDKSGGSERCLFVTVTPEILKPLETNEILPRPNASLPQIPIAQPYAQWPSPAGPVMQAMPVAPPSLTRDLLFRTPLPAAEWSPPTATPLLPPVEPFGNPIQQLGGWQPMPSVMTPWPSAGPANVPAKASRLEYLKAALKHLQSADLPEQVAVIQNEIVCEQKSEVRRELKQREQQLETLQRQVDELRRSLSSEETPQPE